ncbi:MAG: hypothetical protein AAF882_18395, partial [Pseudomonadota bacterium]
PEPEPQPQPEPEPEPEPMPGPAAFSLFVADTATDETLFALEDGMVIDLDDVEGRSLTIYAEANGNLDPGSVVLQAPGLNTQVENVTPYALFGDINGDFKGGAGLDEGDYSLSLTAYSGTGGRGSVLDTMSVSFSVADDMPTNPVPVGDDDPLPDPEPPAPEDPAPTSDSPSYMRYFIADTDTDETIAEIEDGGMLDASLIDGRKITVYAEVEDGDGTPTIGSMKMSYGDQTQIENYEPYALFGNLDEDFLRGQTMPDGDQEIEIEIFSKKNGKGTLLETVTLDFEVKDSPADTGLTLDAADSFAFSDEPLI